MGKLDPLLSSKSEEWYTPDCIIGRAIVALGEIDLDPCSNSKTSPIVPAGWYYTREDDGLSLPWHGRVYMNPPYGREIAGWIKKLVAEYQAGRVTQALALLSARTDTRWMARLRDFPRCFIRGRLRFSDHDNGAPFPSVVVALGCELETFIAAFEDIGDIYQLANARPGRYINEEADAGALVGSEGPIGGSVPTKRCPGHGGWLELRMVNGCGPYAYERWWQDGRKRTRYLGKVKR